MSIQIMGVKEKKEKLANGGVFIVYARPVFNRQKRCLYYKATFVLEEGRGEAYSLNWLNDCENSIPVQVELKLMEIDCLPSWNWYWDGYEYVGQFAHERNYKTKGNFSAENSPLFAIL